jgi:integrase
MKGLTAMLGLNEEEGFDFGRIPVCCSNSLGIMDASNFYKWWTPWREKIGLPGFEFHSLRHTQGTRLVNDNVAIPKVSYRLGHADITTTERFYLHAEYENDRCCSDAIARMISKEEPKHDGNIISIEVA